MNPEVKLFDGLYSYNGAVLFCNTLKKIIPLRPGNKYQIYLANHTGKLVSKDFINNLYRNAIASGRLTDEAEPVKGTYIIGDIKDGVLSLSDKPKVHDNEAIANKEAERLAGKYPGTKFAVLRIMGVVQTSGVSWE